MLRLSLEGEDARLNFCSCKIAYKVAIIGARWLSDCHNASLEHVYATMPKNGTSCPIYLPALEELTYGERFTEELWSFKWPHRKSQDVKKLFTHVEFTLWPYGRSLKTAKTLWTPLIELGVDRLSARIPPAVGCGLKSISCLKDK